MKRILIIDDDQSICKELKELLDNSGYEGIILNDFSDVIAKIESINPDLILLDINIPFVNGEMLLHDIRSFSHVPIIMVTSRNNESDEVLSMSYGADDYITKPYNPTILLLHISAVLKRMEVSSDIIKYDDLTILSKKGVIKNESQELILTKNELLVFSFLYTNRGNIVSRDALMTELWNNDEYINDNALFKQIAVFFLIPLLLANIHSIFGLEFCRYILETFGDEEMVKSITMTVIFLTIIYGGYFVVTYICSKNIIKEGR